MKKSILKNETIIAVDFDGTITTCSDMGNEPVIRENAKEVLERLYDDGIQLVLWTCRTGQYMEQAIQFLEDNNMLHLFAAINENIREVKDTYGVDSRKVGADIYIDDRNVFTSEINWVDIENWIYGEEN